MGALHGVLDSEWNLQSISKSKAFWVWRTGTLLETALCMGWHEWAGIVAWTWIVTA